MARGDNNKKGKVRIKPLSPERAAPLIKLQKDSANSQRVNPDYRKTILKIVNDGEHIGITRADLISAVLSELKLDESHERAADKVYLNLLDEEEIQVYTMGQGTMMGETGSPGIYPKGMDPKGFF